MTGECLADTWSRVKGLGRVDLWDTGLPILVRRACAHQVCIGMAQVLRQSARLIPALGIALGCGNWAGASQHEWRVICVVSVSRGPPGCARNPSTLAKDRPPGAQATSLLA